jgi:gliding motility-associated-like protein
VLGTTATVTITPPSGATTQYVLTGATGACSSSDTISITSNPLPLVDAGPNISIFNGQSGSIGGSPTNPGNGTIVWQPAAGLSDTSATNPVASPTITTTYSVFVTNPSGCVGMDTVTVVVLPTFVIPNGFSPNSDGYNDVWMIDNIYKFPNCEVEVYNRWGEQLFYSKGYGTPWNGTYQGKPVPVGTYYYVIRLNDPEKKFPDHYTGPITILR